MVSILRFVASASRVAISVGRRCRLPWHHRRLVQRHEVDLTRWATLCTAEEYFVVAFTQEFKALSFLVHEDTVQMTRFNGTYLNQTPLEPVANRRRWRNSPQLLYCPIPWSVPCQCKQQMSASRPTAARNSLKLDPSCWHTRLRCRSTKEDSCRSSWAMSRCSVERLVLESAIRGEREQRSLVWIMAASGWHSSVEVTFWEKQNKTTGALTCFGK